MPSALFDDELLEAYMRGFYGFGTYLAPYWFIGMEQGGGGSFAEIERRLNAWRDLGRNELEGLLDYHERIGIMEWFGERARLQSTWSKLIRIILAAEGREVTTERVREYQRCSLGKVDGESCLLELLPLPSPGLDQWLYAQHSRLPLLANRETYREQCAHWRAAHIRQRVEQYRPRAVVFYGLSYREWWEEVAGVALSPDKACGAYVGSCGRTLFIATKHPAAMGVANGDFDRVGALIRDWQHSFTG